MLPHLIASDNLNLAFARVEASHGMAGVDGITMATFKHNLTFQLAKLAADLHAGTYFPLPLLRLLVAKADGSPRALAVPAVRDRVAQAAVFNLLEPLFEPHLEEVSFAYRQGRSVRLAALRLKELRDHGYRFVVNADLDAYFDNIDHALLFAKIATIVSDPQILRLLRLWVRAEVYDGKWVLVMEKGIPQGAVISPLLANLFLDELDEALLARGYQLVRYADDFIILAKSRPEAETALEFTEGILARLHLALDAEDTALTDFDQGFTFLGLIFLKDAIFTPFDRPKRAKRVLYFPPPFDLAAYLAARKSSPGG